MNFEINKNTYEIKEINEDELKEIYIKEHFNEKKNEIYIFGRTDFVKHLILISNELNNQEKIKTLKHELCHCWMWNTANANHQEYDEEHICEIVANSNDFINEIVSQYKKIMQLE